MLSLSDTQKSYLKHAGIGAGAGTVVGGVAGHLTGRARQAMLAKKAREEASRGVFNKALNAINGNRLRNIENAAKKKINLTEHTMVGAGLGALGGAAGSVGTKYFRDKAAQKKQMEADAEARAKEIADLRWKSSKEYKDLQKQLAKDEKERTKIIKKRAKNIAMKKAERLQAEADIAYEKAMEEKARQARVKRIGELRKMAKAKQEKAKKPSSFGLSGGNPNSERNLQGAVIRTHSYVGFSKEDKIRRGNKVADEYVRELRNYKRRISARLNTHPLKGAAIGSLVGAGLASSKTAISHERQVRELAKKLRKQNPELEYDESIKKARAVLGSLRHKLKDSAIKGAVIGGTVGGLGTAATNAVKNHMADKASWDNYTNGDHLKGPLSRFSDSMKMLKADEKHTDKAAKEARKVRELANKLGAQEMKRAERKARMNGLMDRMTKSKYEQKYDALRKYQLEREQDALNMLGY